MRPEEIMVLDWFKFRYITMDKREITRIFRVSRIEDELGRYYVWGDGFGRMCYPERLEPIPLTPEILEKNGFKEMLAKGFFRLELSKGYDYWCVEVSTTKGYELLYLDIEHTCDDIGQGGIDNLKIHSVHELQHALRLCGITKEIVL